MNKQTQSSAPQKSAQISRSFGGLALIVLSFVFMIGGWQLGLGVPTRLGTGAFPFLTGLVLAVLATVIFLEDLGTAPSDERADWIELFSICAALAVFAATAERLGLVPAVFLTVIVASMPDRSLPLVGKAVLGAVVSLGCWVIFVELLNLPLKPF